MAARLIYSILIMLLLPSGTPNGKVFFNHQRNPWEPVLLPAKLPGSLVAPWYDLELSIIRRKAGFAAPVAARALGYTGIILYESLINSMPGYISLAGQLGFPETPANQKSILYNPVASANSAMAQALKYFVNPNNKELGKIDSLEEMLNKPFLTGFSEETIRLSKERGKQIAAIIFQWSLTDRGKDGCKKNYSLYPGKQAGGWEPTQFDGCLLPDWGSNRPFIKISNVIPSPTPYSDDARSKLYRDAREVYKVSLALTSEQTDIARFWSDGVGYSFTPGGHSINILSQVIKTSHCQLSQAAVAYAKLGIALNDAFIYCWQSKYRYHYVRPVTYIRRHMQKDWIPFLSTPSFPEYTSGHSAQAGASAEVLSDMFGKNYAFTDYSNDTLGYTPRRFTSFDAFAREAAISRLYGGIHFRPAIEVGLEQGRVVGRAVNKLKFSVLP